MGDNSESWKNKLGMDARVADPLGENSKIIEQFIFRIQDTEKTFTFWLIETSPNLFKIYAHFLR